MACNDWIHEDCVGLHVHVGLAGDEEFQFARSDCARSIGLQDYVLMIHDTATGTQYIIE